MTALPTTPVPSCPMCGSFRRKPYGRRDGGFGYVRCRSCATVYADPRLADEVLVRRLDEFAPDTSNDTPEALRAAVEAERWKVELVDTLPLAGRRLLDVGTGSGAFLAAAAAAGFEPQGHDLAPAVAAAAQRRHGHRVHTGELRAVEGCFDAVTLWDALEHAVRPPDMLVDCARLLAPGGYVVVLSPHSAGVSARALRDRWWVYGPTDHIVLFSVVALRHALAAAGLRTVTLTTRQLSPPYPPEASAPDRPLVRAHARVAGSARLQAALSRRGMGDWIFAAAGRPATR